MTLLTFSPLLYIVSQMNFNPLDAVELTPSGYVTYTVERAHNRLYIEANRAVLSGTYLSIYMYVCL